MKIETQETKFQPVTITLESQAELDALYIVFGEVTSQQVKNAKEHGLSIERRTEASKESYSIYKTIHDSFYS